MKPWLKILAFTLPTSFFLLLLLSILLLRLRLRKQHPISPHSSTPPIHSSLQSGFHKLPLPLKSASSARKSLRFHPLKPVLPSRPFAFPRCAFGPSCHRGANQSSAEFMQTVRLNPGSNNSSSSKDPSFSFVTTSLPLPGSTNDYFPQEAYFEITILYLQFPKKKLMKTGSNKGINGSSGFSASAPIMFAPQETIKGNTGDYVVSLGLVNRSSMSNQSVPGTFAGSIGFLSDGSVFLDGKKLVFESEKAEWADVNRVIGCGYAPRKKKVFFTVDSQIVHVIRCGSEVFSSPLYPVMAADADAMILVNLGQAPFKYGPANATRSQNPSFLQITTGGRSPASSAIEKLELSGSVRSGEAEWDEQSKRSRNQRSFYSSSSKKSSEYLEDGIEAEADLFEISLQR